MNEVSSDRLTHGFHKLFIGVKTSCIDHFALLDANLFTNLGRKVKLDAGISQVDLVVAKEFDEGELLLWNANILQAISIANLKQIKLINLNSEKKSVKKWFSYQFFSAIVIILLTSPHKHIFHGLVVNISTSSSTGRCTNKSTNNGSLDNSQLQKYQAENCIVMLVTIFPFGNYLYLWNLLAE